MWALKKYISLITLFLKKEKSIQGSGKIREKDFDLD